MVGAAPLATAPTGYLQCESPVRHRGPPRYARAEGRSCCSAGRSRCCPPTPCHAKELGPKDAGTGARGRSFVSTSDDLDSRYRDESEVPPTTSSLLELS